MSVEYKLLAASAAMLITGAASAREDLSLCKTGWAETQSGNHAKAVELFEKCIENGELSGPSLARTYRNIGIAHRRNGQAELAIPFYDKALALNPPDPWSDYINKGNAYSEIKKYDEALMEYERAQKANPTHGEIPYNRGVVFERQGKPDLAAAEFRKAYELGLRTSLLYERMVFHKLIEPAK